MASDRIVTPQHVLKSVMEYERRGSTRLLSELEKLEPQLMEYFLEGLSRVFHQLTDLGLSGREARKVYRKSRRPPWSVSWPCAMPTVTCGTGTQPHLTSQTSHLFADVASSPPN